MRSNNTSNFWSREQSDLFAALHTDSSGLTSDEAQQRLRAIGSNTIVDEPAANIARLALRQLASPLVLILVFGGAVSALLREWVEAAIILAVLLGSTALGFVQEYRASTSVAMLRRRLALTVKVRRDGEVRTLAVSQLVPGDIIELAAGNLVPADGVVLAARDFLVTEASLTGESYPVEKRAGVVELDAPIAQRTNSVFLGTSVRSGNATVLIVGTGERTAFGSVAARLRTAAPDTDFARGVQQFGVLLLRTMLVMVIFVLAINDWLGRPLVESLLFAVALAVGLSPELLPAIISVTLSAGARRMAQRGVIVRRLEAIENLGSMDVLCTDKTGTLTEGLMTLHSACDPTGTASEDALRLAFWNAALETGIDNPLDAALVAAGNRAGLSAVGLRKIDEIPYDFMRKRLTIIVEPVPNRPHLLITKGAFENVLDVCTHLSGATGSQPLNDVERARLESWFREQGALGLRILALATREFSPRREYSRNDEVGMTFVGFLLFRDPPKSEVEATLKALAQRGICVKIVTGDNRYVAAQVARSVGLDAEALLTGAEIGSMKDEALWHRAEETVLFVEVDPQQKERVVRALQHRGHAVGYLGDGINDAPAMHAADVGISVDQAVDVARESADVVLLRPDLAVLCQGVEDGRRTFANTLKYIAITTSANFGNMVSMALATPLLPFLPLVAKQTLLNNFLSDVPSIAISTDHVDEERLLTAQRWHIGELRHYMIVFGLASTSFDLLTFWLFLQVFHAGEAVFQTAWFTVSLLTELSVVLVLRTQGPFWRSRPSRLLMISTATIGALALALPFSGTVASLFGFVPLNMTMLAAIGSITLGYIIATELLKRHYYAESSRRPH
ncbi:MAG: magnesium-translocating P-type ATPase [Proteobacteria bacterium]|nr:magnesium-translocating P-type ATPase [Pseudomonadota bacterium]